MHRYIESRPPLRFLIAAGGQKFSREVHPPPTNTALRKYEKTLAVKHEVLSECRPASRFVDFAIDKFLRLLY